MDGVGTTLDGVGTILDGVGTTLVGTDFMVAGTILGHGIMDGMDSMETIMVVGMAHMLDIIHITVEEEGIITDQP